MSTVPPPNNNNPPASSSIVLPAGQSAPDVQGGHVGGNTQAVAQQIQGYQQGIQALNNSMKGTNAQLQTVNQEVADLEAKQAHGKLSGGEQNTLTNDLASQAQLVSTANGDLQELKQMQQQLTTLMTINMPAAVEKDKEEEDRKNQSEAQQLADQQANQAAAAAATQQASAMQAQLSALKPQAQKLVNTMTATKDQLASQPANQIDFQKSFGAGSGYQDSGLNS